MPVERVVIRSVPILAACLALLGAPPATASWPGDNRLISSDLVSRNRAVSVSDGLGGEIVVWEETYRGEINLIAERFDAASAPLWGPGIAVCQASGSQRFPTIASDGAGGAVIAWQDGRSGTFDIYAQRLTSGGSASWTANGVALCTATGSQQFPDIVSDGAGGAIVTWADPRSGSGFDVYARRVNSAGTALWTADGVALCTATGNQLSATIVSDGSGGAIVGWADSRAGSADIYVRRVDNAGTPQWTANGVALCTATGVQVGPLLVADGTGGAIAVWQDPRSGTNNDVYARRVNATGTAQWAADGVAVCTAANDQGIPSVAADGLGGVMIAWDDLRNGVDTDVYAQRLNNSGVAQWTLDGVALCTESHSQAGPRIVGDGAGGAIVAWNDLRNGVDYDLYARRINGAGAPQWAANGVALCQAAGNCIGPGIVTDGAGGAIVEWDDPRAANSEIYTRRIDGSGVPQWTADGVRVCNVEPDQFLPQAAPDGAGGAIVVWEERFRAVSDIWAQRVSAAGDLLWNPDGVAVCTAPGQQGRPVVVADGLGGAIATWYDLRGAIDLDIFAQRINGAGATQWAVDGVQLCNAVNSQSDPRIVTDGANGAIVAWNDARPGTNYDIYARRVSSAGVPQWGANGVALCTATGDQFEMELVSDAAGGAIAVWQDERSGSGIDLYARRINSAGVAQWAANGVALCTASDDQTLPAIATDGAGGAIVSWQDLRVPSNPDVYAARVSSGGLVPWTANGVVVCSATGSQGGATAIVAGAGGDAIVAWSDGRAGSTDLYAQDLSATGVAQWTANGVALCTAIENQDLPALCTDGAGGAWAAWQDGRSSASLETDLYGRRVTAAGAPQSPADGFLFCGAADLQYFPLLVPDGAGGAIAVWMDQRGDSYDVYAHAISPTGPLAVGPAATILAPRLEVAPNPMTTGTVLRFSTPSAATVTLDLYDVLGRHVRRLASGALAAGDHSARWDGRDDAGHALPSAVYFCRLTCGDRTLTRRIVKSR